MANAMETVSKCEILKANPLLTFSDGKYSYRIERKGDRSIYSVTDGQQTITAPIGWAFGLGLAGQTYVFEKDGEFYESRISYYREFNGLDLTMGAANLKPANIMQAAGRFMGRDERIRCFGCHATHSNEGMQLRLDHMTAGIHCERCHGPVANHLAGLRSGNRELARMEPLGKLSTEDLSNFCGQCHRTWAEIAGGSRLGILNVRFQPYRLTNSKCYDSDDPRISCIACHDPHREVEHNDVGYDVKCQACHGGGKLNAVACKVARRNCVSCHMPKLELPGAHHKFTDHEIRIARTNA
ncbi:MAG: multiheme c-type cytochrome, partial [Bryobacteraceae bacterium]